MKALLLLVPVWVWALVATLALSGAYVTGRWHAGTKCELRELRAEAKADGRAEKVTEDADKRADKIRADVRQDTEESTDEAAAIVDGLPDTCPQQPQRLRDLGESALEGARGEVLPAS